MNVALVPLDRPEVSAYSLARLSRSADTYADILAAITDTNLARFVDRNVIQYGHSSVKDLAPIGTVIEGLTTYTAADLIRYQLGGHQERSTRYQFAFLDTDAFWEIPWDAPVRAPLREAYRNLMLRGFARAREVYMEAKERVPERRAIDIARFFLPAGTLTSVGTLTTVRAMELQIANARTYHPSPEMTAVTTALLETATAVIPNLGPRLHADAQLTTSDPELDWLAHTFEPPEPHWKLSSRTNFEIICFDTPHVGTGYAVETLATYLYMQTPHPWSYKECVSAVECLGMAVTERLYRLLRDDLESRRRGDVPPWFETGLPIVIDGIYDFASMRDLWRHRPPMHIVPPWLPADWVRTVLAKNGGTSPTRFLAQGPANRAMVMPPLMNRQTGTPTWVQELVDEAWVGAHLSWKPLVQALGEHPSREQQDWFRHLTALTMPLGAPRRAVMKMTPREFRYIVNLRTEQQGNFVYRALVQSLWEQMHKLHPYLADLCQPDMSHTPWE